MQKKIIVLAAMLALLHMPLAAAEKGLSPSYTCSGTLCAGFSYDGGAEALILDTISCAERNIKVAIYSFSSKKIAEALLAAKKRGVEVQIILDDQRNRDRYSSKTFLLNQGFQVRVVSLDDGALMHHKFMVVDQRWVQTGSFNYTKGAAQRNAENVIRTDDKVMVQRYDEEWSRLWRLGK